MKNGWILNMPRSRFFDLSHYEDDKVHNENAPAVFIPCVKDRVAYHYRRNGDFYRPFGPAIIWNIRNTKDKSFYFFDGHRVTGVEYEDLIKSRKERY